MFIRRQRVNEPEFLHHDKTRAIRERKFLIQMLQHECPGRTKRSGVIHSMFNACDASVSHKNSFNCFVNPRARNNVAVSSKT
jgi:hypothetical protein